MSRVTRRTFVGTAGLLATAGLTARAADARVPPAAAPPRLAPASLDIALVQAPPWATAAVDARRDRLRNAERMLEHVAAARRGRQPHWVAFGDLAVDGLVLDDPDDATVSPLDAGDPALRALCRGAERHGCWISFGARVRVRSRTGGRPSRALVVIGPGGALGVLEAAAAARGAVLRTPLAHVAFARGTAEQGYGVAAPPEADLVLQLTSAWMPHGTVAPAGRPAGPGAFTARIGSARPSAGPPELCPATGPGITALYAPDGSLLAGAVDCAERIIAGTLPLADWRASRQVG